MEKITKAVSCAAKEVFLKLGFVEIKGENLILFMTPTINGFEAIGITQIQIDIFEGYFKTSVILERRINHIEKPLENLFSEYNKRQPTFATTLWFSFDYFLDNVKEIKFKITKEGVIDFQDMIFENICNLKKIADNYENIFVLDELINSEYKMKDLAKQILIENIPRVVKRLVISRLAGNSKWKDYYEKSLVEYEDSLKTLPTEGFKKIIQQRIDTLHKVYELIPTIKPIRPLL